MESAGVWLFLYWITSSAQAEVFALPLEFEYFHGLRIFIRKKECKTGQSIRKGAKNGYFLGLSPKPVIRPPTVGENREFWLLKTSLIFQVISWDLDVNVLKHRTMKILLEIKRYFKFVL